MEKAVTRLRTVLAAGTGTGKQATADSYHSQFTEAMDDDFNTAQGSALLFDLARDINRAREEGAAVGEAQKVLRELGGVLGLTFDERQVAEPDAAPFIDLLQQFGGKVAEPAGTAAAIEALIKVRAELRSTKRWADADRLRGRLAEMNVVLDDTTQGTAWKYRGKT